MPSVNGTQMMLHELALAWERCARCKLHRLRHRVVSWRGEPRAKIAILGEGPGAEEDKAGIPFVGRAGSRLNHLLFRAGLHPEHDVIISNVVGCRPPGNRNPQPDELLACERRWKTWLWVVKPKVVVMLGGVAARAVAHIMGGIKEWRGEATTITFLQDGEIVKLQGVPTFHPSYALRAGKWVDQAIVGDLRFAKELAYG